MSLGGEYYDPDDEEYAAPDQASEIADAEFDLDQSAQRANDAHAPEGERLQKVLARAGVGSRRACEDLIAKGKVTVDGKRATLGMRVDPQSAVVRVDGARVQTRDDLVYLAFNKPLGVLSAMSDDRDRPTLADYLQRYSDKGVRLFHVGRLDFDTEGLILLTNDGALAHKLAHPSYGVPKTYLAEVIGPVAKDVGKRLRDGIELEDGPAKVDSFRLVDTNGNRVLVELILHEGRKHIVRRMLAEVGHPVQSLVRTRFGPVNLGGQRPGVLRPLTSKEIADLFAIVDQ
ncbi:pseudouridine synthase [Epidermidibacterium keratini]|uniref:Pseudouridine synthase n=2 Tax=Epidermidibacterium keratini TaxID=1891644 RepID=A0A7L4YTV6_9ACTN|nr:pseudouridine synthase [Epidermidibacterium keratini]